MLLAQETEAGSVIIPQSSLTCWLLSSYPRVNPASVGQAPLGHFHFLLTHFELQIRRIKYTCSHKHGF